MISEISFSAAVAFAGLISVGVFMVVMITTDTGMVAKATCNKCFNRRIGIAGNTAKQLDATFGKCQLCTASDTAADQNIRIQRMEKVSKCSVSLTVCVDDTALLYLTVLNIVS